MNPVQSASHEAIVDIGRRLNARGMLAGTDGNISARVDQDHIAVTPSGLAKGRLSAEDIIVVGLDGRPVAGKHRPSSELPMHLFMYRSRADVRACIHSHAPFATAFATAGIPLEDNVLPEVVLFVGPIAYTQYAPPGTDAVPEALKPFAADHEAFLLRNHGLLTVGGTLEEAYHRHETVEHYARILFLARQLGHVKTIPPEDVQRLKRLRRRPDSSADESS